MLSGKASKGIKSLCGYRSGTIVSEIGTIPAGGNSKFNVALGIVLGVWRLEEWTGATEDELPSASEGQQDPVRR